MLSLWNQNKFFSGEVLDSLKLVASRYVRQLPPELASGSQPAPPGPPAPPAVTPPAPTVPSPAPFDPSQFPLQPFQPGAQFNDPRLARQAQAPYPTQAPFPNHVPQFVPIPSQFFPPGPQFSPGQYPAIPPSMPPAQYPTPLGPPMGPPPQSAPGFPYAQPPFQFSIPPYQPQPSAFLQQPQDVPPAQPAAPYFNYSDEDSEAEDDPDRSPKRQKLVEFESSEPDPSFAPAFGLAPRPAPAQPPKAPPPKGPPPRGPPPSHHPGAAPPSQAPRSSGARWKRDHEVKIVAVSLFVGGLSSDRGVTEKVLSAVFGHFGSIKKIIMQGKKPFPLRNLAWLRIAPLNVICNPPSSSDPKKPTTAWSLM